jgi:hypothetical protein
MKRMIRLPRTAMLLAALYLSTLVAAHAQDADWLATPSTSDFNTPANWDPATVPTGTATFGTSNITSLTVSQNTTVGTLQFNAPNYTFDIPVGALVITGS